MLASGRSSLLLAVQQGAQVSQVPNMMGEAKRTDKHKGRLGIHAAKIEAIREQQERDASGFRPDGTDPAKGDKEAMLKDMYRRADSHLLSGIGPADAGDSEN